MTRAILLSILASGLALSAATQTPATAALPTTADSLTWLTGCWRMTRPDGFVEEHWLAPAGGSMIGLGRTLRNGKMTEYEFLAIMNVNGRLVYVAKPSGQAEAAFPLLKAGAAEVIFENLAHDFPQRIIYRRNADASLTARIEGATNGQVRGVDFPYTSCR